MMNQHVDIAVIGGGIAGLSVAALAARQGRSVVLLERHSSLGGRGTTDREQGFSLNRGAHALYGGGAARRVLASLDIVPRGAEPDGNGGLALIGDTLQQLPAGPMSLLWSGLLDLSGKLEIARILTALRKVDVASLDAMTVAEYIARNVKNASARALLELLVRVSNYNDEFDRMSAGLSLDQLRRATYDKVMYVDEGWQTIVDRLAERARAAGATLTTGAAVRAIEAGDVVLDDARISARNIVIAASPAIVSQLVPEFSHRTVPVRAACLDLALSSLPRPRTRLVLGVDRPLYLSVHSAWARVAPEGAATVHLARYLREDERGGEEHIAELEALMERVQPGYRARVVVRRALPNMVVHNDRVDAERGGLAGRASIVARPGVLLAGDWVGHEGLLADAALASAESVVRAIVEPKSAAA